jgi:hypothetical protein
VGQLLSRVAEVVGCANVVEPLEEDGESELFLASVAPVDRRLANTRAGGDAVDGESADADLGQQLLRRVEDRFVGRKPETGPPTAAVLVAVWFRGGRNDVILLETIRFVSNLC